MKNPEIKSLYKYKPINLFTLDIIANERIFYALPESFNDPFDAKCSFKRQTSTTPATTAQTKKHFPNGIRDGITAYSLNDHTQDINEFEEKLKSYGILSLSENCKDILMWSHYADDHKGLCIEFERTESCVLGDDTKTKKVNYTKAYPSLTPNIFNSKSLMSEAQLRVLYTKSEQWSYEYEWRSFIINGGTVERIPGRIKSIIFGNRASNSDIDIIRKIVADRNIPLFKASLKSGDFGLKLNKII
ncbi:DUF2971 domain-containing protein [Tolumonas osonensis]|uniref:Cytochrome b involved in lipid metabolism n=1 Tax=Tolumonas osonensis TaxID=675874 RepID=A0A841G6R7_9GAMM|nr:DUF2971 domain-containing protein [Tolumonas osonensis]MBB6054608.1 cytochrome b involved in lipid metabolism [Tolumonas osonensis]